MKQPDARLFDDLARMAGGAVNVFASLREQIAQDVRARVEDMAAQMDLIPREEFDRLALQVEALQKRIVALEGAAAAPKGKTEQTAAKPASKATSKTAKPATKSAAKKSPSGKAAGKKRA